jgi:hypothetical protein
MQLRRFKLGIVVLAYHRPDQLAMMLATLRHPQVTIYLHIDSGVDISPFRRALAAARVGEVVWLRRHRSNWGSLGIVDAELEGIAQAMADRCSYVLVISGEDFPLRPVEEIVEFAETNRERSYVETFALPYRSWPFDGRQRTDFYTCRLLGALYTCVPRGEDTKGMTAPRRLLNWGLRARFMFARRRRFPPYLRPYGGQQWLNLSPAASRYTIDFVSRHPDYRHYHRYTACPDELFVQSILLGSDFAGGHEIVNDDLRFLIWTGGDHPKLLELEDLPAMVESSDLFARKVDGDADPQLLAALRERASRAVRR